MLVHCHNTQKYTQDNDSIAIESRTSPVIDMKLDDLEAGSREMVQIRVLKDDKYVNFWVRTWVDNNNRVKCEVSTNLSNKAVRKSITAGSWRDRR